MVAAIPALWFNGLPPVMAATFGSMPVAMLVLLGLLAAAVVVLYGLRGVAPQRRRRLRVVQRQHPSLQVSARCAR